MAVGNPSMLAGTFTSVRTKRPTEWHFMLSLQLPRACATSLGLRKTRTPAVGVGTLLRGALHLGVFYLIITLKDQVERVVLVRAGIAGRPPALSPHPARRHKRRRERGSGPSPPRPAPPQIFMRRDHPRMRWLTYCER